MYSDFRLLLRCIGLGFVITLFVSCSHYNVASRGARSKFDRRDYMGAAKDLEIESQKEGLDQLLFVLDRATALHHAGEIDSAIKEFQRADKIADISDYTSLSKEVASVVTSEKTTHYKGENFEKILINQYLAIEYALKHDWEGALVEARRVNRKLYMMIHEGKRPYQLNGLAYYLSGFLYEQKGYLDDAYIDYKKAVELIPHVPVVRRDVVRLAQRMGRAEDIKKWREEFQKSFGDDYANLPKATSLVAKKKSRDFLILVESGQSPEKVPHENWQAIPKYASRMSAPDDLLLEIYPIDGDGEKKTQHEDWRWLKESATLAYSVDAVAKQVLEDKYAGILAKRIAGVVVKETIAYGVEKEVSPLLGGLLRLGLHLSDQADCRSWLTLPYGFYLWRGQLPAESVAPSELVIRVSDGQGSMIEKYAVVPKSGPLVVNLKL